ncbi:MAG: hypothetical protein JWM11_5278, partial [Planctomycetaceae bacterium]|nr:hypothetical protein [Planctomycetaceae bacterium]
MRRITISIILFSLSSVSFIDGLRAEDSPLVEKYLHSGQLAKGEQVQEAALETSPKDDQIRFGLGVLRFVRGVERLGQSLYEYGCRPENTRLPFVRLPIPANPDPTPITYSAFRRVLINFQNDLDSAEKTLAAINDSSVVLPLRLADVRLDLDGDGRATDKLIDML